MSDRETLVDLLRVPPTPEESAVLASLKGRYRGERLYRECVDYLTGRVQHVADPNPPRAIASEPTRYDVAVEGVDALRCAIADDWIAESSGLTGRLPIDIRPVGPDEEPATYRVDMFARTPVTPPQWLRNVTRRALEVAADIEADVAEAGADVIERLIASGAECAKRIREREGDAS